MFCCTDRLEPYPDNVWRPYYSNRRDWRACGTKRTSAACTSWERSNARIRWRVWQRRLPSDFLSALTSFPLGNLPQVLLTEASQNRLLFIWIGFVMVLAMSLTRKHRFNGISTVLVQWWFSLKFVRFSMNELKFVRFFRFSTDHFRQALYPFATIVHTMIGCVRASCTQLEQSLVYSKTLFNVCEYLAYCR